MTKLSEAIREGAKLRPQAFGEYFAETDQGLCSCAVGAAIEAATGKTSTHSNRFVRDTIGQLLPALALQDSVPCPVTGCECDGGNPERGPCVWVATHLNDDHHWTREAIADWLEQQGF